MSRKSRHVPKTHVRSTRAAGFWLAIIAYFLLFFVTQRLSVPMFLLWYVLLPLLTGFVAARGTQQIDTIGQRFKAGFWACGWPAAFYTAVKLMLTHDSVGRSPAPGAVFLIGLFVTIAYALLAGIVAGVTGVVVFHRGDRVGQGGSA